MPDWNALRRRAYRQHQELRVHLNVDAPLLPSADSLLAAAALATDVERRGVPVGDSLLAGAHAVLDRDIPGIWYASGEGVSRARQRFAQAHEFAHFWLHPEIGQDACIAPDTPDAFAPPELRLNPTQIVEGYSSRERREAEANLFAAELLLPGPVLRRLVSEEGWSASRIADQSGLSLSCVVSQLASALLTGERKKEKGKSDAVTTRPVQHENASDTAVFSGKEQQDSTTPFSFFLSPFSSNDLDASQREAAHIAHGPVLVDAGPGTGKTRTLIARILFLLNEKHISPENVLALTFSNKAAEEMRTRLRASVGDLADRVWIGTFHAFGMELLRKEGHALGLPPAPELLDTPDAILLLLENLDRLGLDRLQYLSFPILPFADILACISRAKDELQTPDDYALAGQWQIKQAAHVVKKADADKLREAGEKSLEVARVYGVYEELLRREGKLDFGDLLMRAVELLDARPDVQARWQAQYPHILADEYQDINRASARLVQRLANDGRGLWAVGDLRQAIYRFRGASSANVRDFERDFPGGRRVQLTRNYRSLPPIVALFGGYAGRMSGTTTTFADWQPQRTMEFEEAQFVQGVQRTRGSQGVREAQADVSAPLQPEARTQQAQAGTPTNAMPAVTLAVADDEEAQADGIAASISQWEARGVGRGEQVILCSTHRQAARLADLLGARGIETQHRSGLFERDEIKDLLALLSLACEPEGTALRRVACFAEYAIPAQDALTLLRAARAQKKTFPAALILAADLPGLSAQGRAGIARLLEHIRPYLYHGSAWTLLTGYLFETSGFLRPLLAEDSVAVRQKRLAVNELLSVALRLSKRFDEEATEEENAQALFLKYLRFLQSCGQEKSLRVGEGEGATDGVRLMTVHQSKGLEFPVVYLPNMIKGQFPPGKHGNMVAPPDVWTQADEEDRIGSVQDAQQGGAVGAMQARAGNPGVQKEEDDDEAQCLFFVALSRARDALILSRPLTWNGKPSEPSYLLQNCEPDLNACGAQRVTWTRARAVMENNIENASDTQDRVTFIGENVSEADNNGGETAGANTEPLTISASAAEQYRRCPRQYYYQRVLRLLAPDEASAYLAYHQTLQAAVTWMQEEGTEGRAPTLDEAHARLRQEWRRGDIALQSAHGRVLQDKARQMLTGAHQAAEQAQAAPTSLELTAHLEHGAVNLRMDHAEEGATGELRLVDYKTDRDDKDHLHPRLALARHAARQAHGERPIQIFLGYLQDDEQIEVKEKANLETARVEKYNEALKGIRDRHFEPNPGNECARCPYFLVCPF